MEQISQEVRQSTWLVGWSVVLSVVWRVLGVELLNINVP